MAALLKTTGACIGRTLTTHSYMTRQHSTQLLFVFFLFLSQSKLIFPVFSFARLAASLPLLKDTWQKTTSVFLLSSCSIMNSYEYSIPTSLQVLMDIVNQIVIQWNPSIPNLWNADTSF